MPSEYPTAAELTTYLRATSLFENPTQDPLSGLSMDAMIGAAVADWENATGYHPFKAQTADEARTFDLPVSGAGDALLDLAGGLERAPTAFTWAGSALTLNTDYQLMPLNALKESRPYTYVKFPRFTRLTRYVFGTVTQFISINGRWGYSLVIGYDVFQAILAKGAWHCYEALALNISGGHMSMRSPRNEEEYGRYQNTGPLFNEAASWQKQFDEVARRHRRIAVA